MLALKLYVTMYFPINENRISRKSLNKTNIELKYLKISFLQHTS